MQRIASAMIADPQNAAMLVQMYQAVAADYYAPVEQLLARFVTPGEPVSWRVMPLAMDVASGIDAARLATVNTQAQSSLLGDVLNFPMPHLSDAMGLNLGDDFRPPDERYSNAATDRHRGRAHLPGRSTRSVFGVFQSDDDQC